ncbi:hypothetical protein B9Z40_00320 [Limnohabitans sp. 15K]|nr:hypothetical protein B9Z40_00320 [Limnohabitans sp. 15K]
MASSGGTKGQPSNQPDLREKPRRQIIFSLLPTKIPIVKIDVIDQVKNYPDLWRWCYIRISYMADEIAALLANALCNCTGRSYMALTTNQYAI